MTIDQKNLESLNEKEVMEMIGGALRSIVDNSDYFYRSSVSPQYSKLYPQGEQMLIKTMSVLLPLLSKAQEEALDRRAKELVIKELKN
jgi:hypothetical protein